MKLLKPILQAQLENAEKVVKRRTHFSFFSFWVPSGFCKTSRLANVSCRKAPLSIAILFFLTQHIDVLAWRWGRRWRRLRSKCLSVGHANPLNKRKHCNRGFGFSTTNVLIQWLTPENLFVKINSLIIRWLHLGYWKKKKIRQQGTSTYWGHIHIVFHLLFPQRRPHAPVNMRKRKGNSLLDATAYDTTMS